MVFFSCNSCGDSVKKQVVEKHKLKCKLNIAEGLSCMDCREHFTLETYNAHTSCKPSEGTPKESSKSLRKEVWKDAWLEKVKLSLESSETLKPELKTALETIVNKIGTNLPTKKNKFKNVAINSLHIDEELAEEGWKILDEVRQKNLEEARQKCSEEATPNGVQQTTPNAGKDEKKRKLEAQGESGQKKRKGLRSQAPVGEKESPAKKKGKGKKRKSAGGEEGEAVTPPAKKGAAVTPTAKKGAAVTPTAKKGATVTPPAKGASTKKKLIKRKSGASEEAKVDNSESV